MSSLLARLIGLSPDDPPPIEATIRLLSRCSGLSRGEARVLVLDYIGYTRSEIRAQFGVSDETITTYWRRIYQKTECRNRRAARAWTTEQLQRELRGE